MSNALLSSYEAPESERGELTRAVLASALVDQQARRLVLNWLEIDDFKTIKGKALFWAIGHAVGRREKVDEALVIRDPELRKYVTPLEIGRLLGYATPALTEAHVRTLIKMRGRNG